MANIINELTHLGRQLGEKSQSLDTIISTVNRKLAGLGLGFEVWLTDDPIQTEGYQNCDCRRNSGLRWCEATFLGWGDYLDDWQLMVKETTFEKAVGSRGSESEQAINSGPPTPLLDAEKTVQIKAMRLLPRLLEELKSEAEDVIASIENIERVA